MHRSPFAILFTLALAITANAHSLIMSVDGVNGNTASGFGVKQSTPRNGIDESDTTRVRILGRQRNPCGSTLGGGSNDIAQNIAAASDDGLPSADEDGSITMTVHQVNADGAGPFKCDISADGTGDSFTPMEVTKQVPGTLGLSLASAKNFPLVAKMPEGMTCTGGPDGNACVVRCTQPIGFGGCAAVTNYDGDSAVSKASSTSQKGNAKSRKGTKAKNVNTDDEVDDEETGDETETENENVSSNAKNSSGSSRNRGSSNRFVRRRAAAVPDSGAGTGRVHHHKREARVARSKVSRSA